MTKQEELRYLLFASLLARNYKFPTSVQVDSPLYHLKFKQWVSFGKVFGRHTEWFTIHITPRGQKKLDKFWDSVKYYEWVKPQLGVSDGVRHIKT